MIGRYENAYMRIGDVPDPSMRCRGFEWLRWKRDVIAYEHIDADNCSTKENLPGQRPQAKTDVWRAPYAKAPWSTSCPVSFSFWYQELVTGFFFSVAGDRTGPQKPVSGERTSHIITGDVTGYIPTYGGYDMVRR
ncbi:hypothetical protein DPMN_109498 [Dreissena polymorpha]|uniref:Uncharacterized protein n=1 Tax=Dreissena polymorpha TaxID=45954 RepID=A0A9D4QM21_DREPO|nr:hypothetical protein DPMN_109498 [Dreissena polymorpha]